MITFTSIVRGVHNKVTVYQLIHLHPSPATTLLNTIIHQASPNTSTIAHPPLFIHHQSSTSIRATSYPFIQYHPYDYPSPITGSSITLLLPSVHPSDLQTSTPGGLVSTCCLSGICRQFPFTFLQLWKMNRRKWVGVIGTTSPVFLTFHHAFPFLLSSPFVYPLHYCYPLSSSPGTPGLRL